MISSFLFEENADMDMDIILLSRYVFQILHYGQADVQKGEQCIAHL
jgi:hypothetical protein